MSSDMWKVLAIFVVILGVIAFLVLRPGASPMINDVTTTPEAPPGFMHLATIEENAGTDMSYQDWMAAEQLQGYPELAPKVSPLQSNELFQRVRLLAMDLDDWEVVHVDQRRYRIEAVATSAWMRFKDDIVIEVRQHNKGSAVHMRSRSRTGRGDMGVNAARIQNFLDKLDVQP